MATIHEIPATLRRDEGKGASRRLRHAGQVPAVLYGAKEAPVSLQLEHNAVYLAGQHEWFYSSILDLVIDGKPQKVLLRDLQRHPFRQQFMHLDFQRVSETEKIRLRVPLHFLNQEKSPAGKTSGAMIAHELTEVMVACLPKDLPEYISVDLADLAVGNIVHLSDIKLPAGVEVPELKLGREHDVAVVTAKMMKEEVEAAPAADAAAAPAAGAPAAKAAAPAAGKAAPAAAAKPAEKKK
jgi:large subunit ribosomal protein L25